MRKSMPTIKVFEDLDFNKFKEECYREFLRTSEILNLNSRIHEEFYFNFIFDMSKIKYIIWNCIRVRT